MKTVYLVTSGVYSDYSVDGVFSTQAKAEKYMAGKKAANQYCEFNGVVPWVVDEMLKEKEHTRFFVTLWLDDGSVCVKHNDLVWTLPKSESRVIPDWEHRGGVFVSGHKSASHTMKIAVEARQKWMRENKA